MASLYKRATPSQRRILRAVWRSPLVQLWKEVASKVGPAKKSGKIERAEALIEVLRLIAELQRKQP
jgi:hypothetical protein